MHPDISAVILVKNDQQELDRCLASIQWCSEIILILDSKTLSQKIKNVDKKVKTFARRLERDYASQRNFGLEKASSEWVLFIDPDEIISDTLKNEIVTKIESGKNIKGFYFKRKDYFLGKWLEFGETAHINLLRLGKKSHGKWFGKVHERWNIKGKTEILENPLEHHPHSSIHYFLEKINNYTDIRSNELEKNGAKVGVLALLFYPIGKFFSNYIVKAGFKDGMPGLIMAMIMSFHSFLVRAKVWQIQNKKA